MSKVIHKKEHELSFRVSAALPIFVCSLLRESDRTQRFALTAQFGGS
jgi:hypothetical protein